MHASRAARFVPQLDALEVRLAPATHTWTGGSLVSGFWSDPTNWDAAGVPTTGEKGGTLVQIPVNDTSMIQNITGLVIDRIQFTNSGSSTLTLKSALGINGGGTSGDIVNSSGANTITGGSLT